MGILICFKIFFRMMDHYNIENPVHPEQPARIKWIFEYLITKGFAERCLHLPCREATHEELQLKHTAEHVQAMVNIRNLGEKEAMRRGHEYNSVSSPTIGGSRDKGVWHTNFGINYGSISFGQLSGYIVFCTVPLRGAKPPPTSKIKSAM